MAKHNTNITYTKAIGILLMVLCHAVTDSCRLIDSFVSMFHMPLFFFVSGYCFKERYVQEPFKFVWQRIKGIWWPYIKWSLLFLALHNVFFELNIYNGEYGYNGGVSSLYTYDDFLSRIESILVRMNGHEQLLGGYWFMKALLYGSIIGFVIIFVSARIKAFNHLTVSLSGGVAVLIICMWLNHEHRSLTILHITPQLLLASIFFMIGYWFKYKNVKTFNKTKIIFSFILIAIGSVAWKMGMGAITYENSRMLPYIVTGTIGTWMLYSLPWDRVKGKFAYVLQFIGNNTLTILTWHFLSFKFVSLLIIFIYGLPIERLAEFSVITEYSVKGWWLAYFLFAMLATCGIAYCNRWIKSPWLKL